MSVLRVRHKTDSESLLASTSGTTHTMDVHGIVAGKFVVDDVVDTLNVKTTSGQVCGQEDAHLTGGEQSEVVETTALGQLTVQFCYCQAAQSQCHVQAMAQILYII